MDFIGNHAHFWMGDGAISSLNHKAFYALVSKLSASAIPIGPPSTINTGISLTLANAASQPWSLAPGASVSFWCTEIPPKTARACRELYINSNIYY